MRRVLASPALHFLALGALLVAAERAWTGGDARLERARAPIELTRARVEALRADWLARRGEAPDGATLRALIEAELDDEILLREARAAGLEASDPVVRARLARNVAFLRGEDELAFRPGDTRRVDEALALGLARSDLVVRRRLIERMRAELAARGAASPDAAELEARATREPGPGVRADRIELSHVFLSRDLRGAALEPDARRLSAEIERGALAFEAAIARGDGFLLGHALPARSADELARDFGPGFARAVAALEPGLVSQPIESSYGLHLVLVRDRRSAAPVSLAAERARRESELAREREAEALRAALGSLRARYEIRVPETGP